MNANHPWIPGSQSDKNNGNKWKSISPTRVALRATPTKLGISTPHPKHPWISWFKSLGPTLHPTSRLQLTSTCGSWLNEVAGEVSTWLANAEKNTKWSYQVLKKTHTHTQICCYLTLVVFQSYRNWGEGCWKIGMFFGGPVIPLHQVFQSAGTSWWFFTNPIWTKCASNWKWESNLPVPGTCEFSFSGDTGLRLPRRARARGGFKCTSWLGLGLRVGGRNWTPWRLTAGTCPHGGLEDHFPF